MKLNQVTVSVVNIEKSFEFYKNLGLKPIVKSDQYARFVLPEGDSTFSIQKIENKPASSTTVYFEIEDLDNLVEELKNKGFKFKENPSDKNWGWREAKLLDPDENVICIYYGGNNRLNPDWRIAESKDSHFLNIEIFKNWLITYKKAWEKCDPNLAASLFTQDAEYYESPFDEPLKDNLEIVKYWKDVTKFQKEITFNFQIINVINDKGYCKWQAEYIRIKDNEKIKLDGIFEVSFVYQDKCNLFKEWWNRKQNK